MGKNLRTREIIGIILMILGIIGILFGLFLSIGCAIEGDKYEKTHTGVYIPKESECEGVLYILGFFYGLGFFGLGILFVIIGNWLIASCNRKTP
jgi:hypothetical protein